MLIDDSLEIYESFDTSDDFATIRWLGQTFRIENLQVSSLPLHTVTDEVTDDSDTGTPEGYSLMTLNNSVTFREARCRDQA